MALDDATIKALLEQDLARGTGNKSTTGSATQLPRPIQFGPLKWYEQEMVCASRNCRGPTRIKISGIPYCITHSLYLLNRMLIEIEGQINLEECTCKAGESSKGNIHTPDCELYKSTKTEPNFMEQSSSV